MKFATYIPSDILQPYVKAFVIQELWDEQAYKVLPDTGIVIGFQYKGRLSYLANEGEIKLAASGITGLRDSYRIFKNSQDIGTVLVLFKEAGAAPFFKTPIHELFSESVSLEHFMLRSELLVLEEQLCEAPDDLKKIKVVEKFLIERLNPKSQDQLVLAALGLIHQHHGNIRIKTLAEQLHISQSPLEKRFRQAVGTSPKKFADIIRLKNTIAHYKSNNSLTELAYHAGFYDQAHFIKEFKTFTGSSPDKYFKE